MTLNRLRTRFHRCHRPPRGWVCYLPAYHNGTCPTWPAWWNIAARRSVRLAAPRRRR